VRTSPDRRPRARARPLAPSALLAVFLAAQGCASAGDFFWVDVLPEPSAQPGETVIGPGDTVAVRVWSQDGMSVRTRVREDGFITLPFLNDVSVAGQQPAELARRLQTRLVEFIVNPIVTVSLEEKCPLQISVVGEVARPGLYQLDRSAGVLQALAIAGGVTAYADKERIFVLRQNHWADGNPSPARIRFSLVKLSRAEGRSGTFRLRAGDTVVVE